MRVRKKLAAEENGRQEKTGGYYPPLQSATVGAGITCPHFCYIGFITNNFNGKMGKIFYKKKCPRQESNLHGLPLEPKSSASASSATRTFNFISVSQAKKNCKYF